MLICLLSQTFCLLLKKQPFQVFYFFHEYYIYILFTFLLKKNTFQSKLSPNIKNVEWMTGGNYNLGWPRCGPDEEIDRGSSAKMF